jgi:transposase
LVCWYEAGACGYGLYRQIIEAGHRCHVVAPSLTPRRAGDRVKTDQRDSVTLARLGRAGELTPVWVPDEAQEAMRDLTRLREDATKALRQARQQLSAFLLRHGRRYTDGSKKWTGTFARWLDGQRFDHSVQEVVFTEYVQAEASAASRVALIEKQMREALEQWSLRPVVQALRALRGVDTVAAMTLLAELGDLRRFDSPRQLMAYLGLVPSEQSSGGTMRRGGITRTGNGHARRILVESAWSYRYQARMTHHLKRKAADAPPAAQAIAWKAQQRLCKRYRALCEKGKLKVQVYTAIARELSGFVWAISCATWPAEAQAASGESSIPLCGIAACGDPR